LVLRARPDYATDFLPPGTPMPIRSSGWEILAAVAPKRNEPSTVSKRCGGGEKGARFRLYSGKSGHHQLYGRARKHPSAPRSDAALRGARCIEGSSSVPTHAYLHVSAGTLPGLRRRQRGACRRRRRCRRGGLRGAVPEAKGAHLDGSRSAKQVGAVLSR